MEKQDKNSKLEELSDEQLKKVAGGVSAVCENCLRAHPDNPYVCQRMVSPECKPTDSPKIAL